MPHSEEVNPQANNHGHQHFHDFSDPAVPLGQSPVLDTSTPDKTTTNSPNPVTDKHRQTARIGIGGPVGSGKTALVADLCRTLSSKINLAVVTNDIYTTEDAEFLKRAGVLDDERIIAVATGCCPHTAIRDDIAANLEAVESLEATFSGLELVLVESGGDNLTATFSYGLIDKQIFVIDVAGGDKVPRKGGPGITRSDLLVINKVDLAPLVGADLDVMAADSANKRGKGPVSFISLRTGLGVDAVRNYVTDVVSGFAAAARSASGAP